VFELAFEVSAEIVGVIAVGECCLAGDSAGANEFYEYSYLFAYPIDLPTGATTLTLPNDDSIRVFAITAANEPATTMPAAPLHDVFPGGHK